MSPLNYARLSLMMFVQFFLWGAWYVANPGYLSQRGFDGGDFAWTYSVGPIAGMISPFFVGMIADRFFATKWVLGVMHILGAFAMFGAALLTTDLLPEPLVPYRPELVNLFFFGHMLCFFPTLSLTNTLAMHTMTNPEKQFPLIRVFGTIGWIAGNMILDVPQLHLANSVNMLYLAAGSGIFMGIYSFTLPHTPPPSAGKAISARQILGLDALVLLKRPAYLAFMVSSFLICIPLAFYYQLAFRAVDQAGFAAPASVMSLGQWSEIFFMLVMPLFFARLGVKWMLFVGMLAWVVRYSLFAVGAPEGVAWMMLTGVVLHGICYDFFFVTGQIYTDQVAPTAIRGQAQGMLVLFTLGIGMLIGAQVAGKVDTYNTPPETGWLAAEAGAVGAAAANDKKALKELLEEAPQSKKAAYEEFVKQSGGAKQGMVASATGYVKKLFMNETAKPEQLEFEKRAKEETVADSAAIEKAQQALLKLQEEAKVGFPWSLINWLKGFFVSQDPLAEMTPIEHAENELESLRKAKVAKLSEVASEMAKQQLDKLATKPGLPEAYELQARIDLLTAYQRGTAVASQRAIHWRNIWMFPAIFAGVIMVLFVFVFRDDSAARKEADQAAEGKGAH